MVRTRGGGPQTDGICPTIFVRSREQDRASNIIKENDIGGNVSEEVNIL